ncbi:MAG: hypothetical protein KBB35_03300 [Bacteroidales bacterium]|jgi:tetratricopeptide (TPR) repeat protein|nr:hypothetical protein [Bacteroidales bacterium]HPB88959.1 hypothetical protein [Bacteroidales bacterium]HQA93294.1 hypothetical protein [Bacteroidales bacterium]HQN23868.1 hypothetical protein [Bacteroidales bacterium]
MMKKMGKLLLMAAVLLVATFSANAKADKVELCDGKIAVAVKDLAPNADLTGLVTNYTITVAPDVIEQCTALILTPVVRDADSKAKRVVEILVISAPGERYRSMWVEEQLYKTCDPNRVKFYTAKKGEYLTIETNSLVSYEAWMDDAKFTVTTQKATYNPDCIENLCGTEEVCDVPYLSSPLTVDPLWTSVTPVLVDIDPIRALKTKLYYPVNVSKSVESYLENQDALALLGTLNQPNFTVASIKIGGWASPEATVAYNQRLSERRAATLKGIIAGKYNFPESIYSVSGNGEYWDDVIDFIATTDDPTVKVSKDELEAAIANNANLDSREAAIRRIDRGRPYKVIFDQVYPRSRFADCTVSYQLRGFNREHALIVFRTDPYQLTENDYIQLLAVDPDPKVLEKAVEIYDNESLYAIAAKAEANAGNYDQAIAYYEKAGDSKEVMNNIACCYLLKGDSKNAEKYLEKTKGLDVYEGNRNELRKVVLNNKYFK